MDYQALDRLAKEGEKFFLPFYVEIVAKHPFGIEAPEVKRIAQERIVHAYGFDPFDGNLTGFNPSTQVSRVSQLANNLVSNQTLDKYMFVARDARRATLYPLTDRSNPTLPEGAVTPSGDPGGALREAAEAANARSPSYVSVPETTRYLRSVQVAESVRMQGGRRCIIGSGSCSTFTGRDGQPYVEIHHIVPMAQQPHTSYNLDQFANAVAICPTCHLKLHRGSRPETEATLQELLDAYEKSRGVSLASALEGCDLGCASEDLLGYYFS